MHRLIFLVFLFNSLFSFATDYYIKNGGNDKASGTSDATAWATITKVNSFSFKPGDRVLFKCGDKWQEQKPLMVKGGNASSNVIYTSYGEGPKPLLLGSKQENEASDWVNVGVNLWSNSDPSFSVEVGNIIFDNEKSCGIRVKNISQLNSQGKWYYDYKNKRILLYSSTNPASYYSNIECALRFRVLCVTYGVSFVTIDGLDIRYSAELGIETSGNNKNIVIKNCNVSWIGGAKTSETGSLRFGNAIQCWYSCSNILIEKNTIDQVYDAGITWQYLGESNAVNVSNIIIRYNLIQNCEMSYEFWCRDNGKGNIEGVYFENNTCINAGGDWGHSQRWSSLKGSHFSSSHMTSTLKKCYIRNNIFFQATEYAILAQITWPATNITWNNNLYYAANSIATVYGTIYRTLQQWQNFSSQDKNSISANPNFISSTDFHLQPNSPAINAGLNLGYTEDFDGNPIVGLPDIGAFEYQQAATPVLPVYVSSVIENDAPAQLVITYDRTLANKVPATSAFTVLVNKIARTVNSVIVSGTKVQLTLATPVAFGDVVTVAYNKPATNPLQTPAGGQAESMAAQTVKNNLKPPEPKYVNSQVENNAASIIEMSFDIALANVTPASQAFSVLVNSVARAVNNVSVSGNKVRLTLSSPIAFGDVVTVAYNKPANNPLQSPDGGQAASFTSKTVKNNVEPPVPVFQSAVIENNTPGIIELTYDLNLAAILPNVSAFMVVVNATERTVSALNISENKVRLYLSSPVVHEDKISITYTKPSVNPLQTSAGGQAESISSRPVTNKVEPLILEYVSSVIENANPDILIISLSLDLANVIPPANAFSVFVNSIFRPVEAVSISDNKVHLKLSNPVESENSVTVSYTKPSVNPLQAVGGEEAQNFSAKPVTNNVIPADPIYLNSYIENDDPSLIVINYDLILANVATPTSAFTVRINNQVKTVSSISVSGSRILLRLSSPAAYGDNITLSYNKPAVNYIQTAAGGEAASFSSKPVINNINPEIPVWQTASVENERPSQINIQYSLSLSNILPDKSAFIVRVNSTERTVNSVSINSGKVILTLASPVVYGDVVTVEYIKPATNPLQTSDGGQAESSGVKTVNNHVDPVKPVNIGAVIENNTANILELNYDLALANIRPATNAFTVMVNSLPRAVNSVTISGSKVLLNLSAPVVYGDNVRISYTKPATNPLQTSQGGQADPINNQTVTNNVLPVVPVFVNATVENAAPDIIRLNYDIALTNIIPSVSAFNVKVNSTTVAVQSINVSGTLVTLRLNSPAKYGDVISISYNKPASQPLQTADGGIAGSFSEQIAENKILPPNPVFINASVEDANPAVLEMNYDLPLITPAPSVTAFSVRVNNISRAISSVTISGTKVRLTLTSAISFGNNVTVSYTKPSQNPLRTADGGQADAITNKNVENNVKAPVPKYSGSIIEDQSPTLLQITYDLPLANIIPDKSAFVVRVNSTERIVNSVSINSGKVILTLASPVVYGDVVTVEYIKPATNPLQTSDGGQAESSGVKTVNNQVDPVKPVNIGAVIENNTANILELNYDLPLANIRPATNAFTVMVNSLPRAVNSVTISGSKVLLNLSAPVVFGDNVRISYTKPATNPLQTSQGGQADPINNQTVTNNVLPIVPVFVNATVENAAPDIIRLNYDIALTNIIPSVSAFNVKVNSTTVAVQSINVSGTLVTLRLNSPAKYGDVISISYNKPASQPLQTAEGGIAGSFSEQIAENKILPPNPVFINASVEDANPAVLEMNYDLPLVTPAPSVTAFSVRVNNISRAISSVTISGTKVRLTLTSAISFGNNVTVSYTKPSQNPLRTADGGQADAITNKNVENNVKAPVPKYSGSIIEDQSPTLLQITYDLPLANIIPDKSAFVVRVNSTERTVNSVSINSGKVILTLASPVVYGDVVTVEYIKPATNPLQTSDGGQAESSGVKTVSNQVDPVKPVNIGAVIENNTANILELNYDLPLANIRPATNAFTVMVNSLPRAVNSVTISGSKVLLNLSAPVVFGDNVRISYTKPATNPLQTSQGVQADPINNQTVTNNVLPIVPVFVNATVENAAPDIIRLNYDIALTNIIPSVSAFNVKVNSTTVAVQSINVSGTLVTLRLNSPAKYGDLISISYNKPASQPLQTADGGIAGSFSEQIAENKILPPNPVFINATVEDANPAVLEMNYDLPLITPAPSVTAFSVRVNNISRAISSVTISGTKVRLTLTSAISFGNNVTVSYSKPSQNPLRTADGGQADAITNKNVENNVKAPVPKYSGSIIEDQSPTLLQITYDLPLANIIPDKSAFVVRVNSTERTVNSISINDNKVILTLNDTVAFGDVVTVEYIKPATNPLQTSDGGQAENSGVKTVNNQVDPVKPVNIGAVVENNTANILELNYDLPLANIRPATNAFTVMVNSLPRAVNSVIISGSKVLLNLSAPVVYGDNVRISYTKPATNPLQTSQGGQADPINNQTVTNNVLPVVPVFINASIEDATPDIIRLNYDIALTNIIPSVFAFSVKINSTAVAVQGINISGKLVTLRLNSPVEYGDVISILYNKPASQPLQTADGGIADSFSEQTVKNNVYPPELIYIKSLVENSNPSQIEILYNLELEKQLPAISSFIVKVNSIAVAPVSINIEGSKVILTLADSVKFGDNITLSYTQPTENPIQSEDGEKAESFADNLVENKILPPNPEFINASVEDASPAVVEMNYDLTLITPAPSVTAFSVRVNNISRAISSVTISGTKVRLTLTNAISFGDNVTVSYSKPSRNPLKTADGGQAAAITNKNVENNIKAPVPKYSGSIIEEQSPTLLQITYDLPLANIIPDKSAFIVRVNSTERTVNSISINDNKVILTLNDPVAFGDVVTVEYIKPAANPLQTSDGGQAESSGVKTVNNQVDPVKPVNIGAVIENNTANILELNYDIALANIRPATNAFTVMINSLPRAVNSVTISGSKVLLNLSAPVVYGDNVRISYTKPATNPLQTSQGGQADAINNQTVTNNVLPVVPVFINASVENAAPDIIRLNYDIELANIIPSVSAFSVEVNSTAIAVQGINISGTLVTLRLNSPAKYGDVISISYNKPASQPLQTADGGIADSFSEQTAENKILPPNPVFINATVEDASPAVVEMNYDLPLITPAPSVTAFSVRVNNISRAISSVTISGTKVRLTLTNAISFGDNVTVSYSKPSRNPLKTTDGGQAAAITNKNVENNIKAPVPKYSGSIIEEQSPTLLQITYDLPLANIIPDKSAFVVRVNSTERTVNSISINDNKVILTLNDTVAFGDVVTVEYIKPAANPLQTSDGGQAESSGVKTVNNQVDPVKPVNIGAVIENNTANILELNYDLELANIRPAANAFTVMVNSLPRAVSSVTISGSKVLLNLSAPVVYGDNISISYSKPATNPLQTSQGGQADPINNQTVTNNVLPVMPVFVNATVENAAPDIIRLNYDIALTNIIPSVSAFNVKVNSTTVAVQSINISGTLVTLRLSSPVEYGDAISISYNKPASQPLQTADGGIAGSFSEQIAENNILPPNPVFINATVEDANPAVIEMNYDLPLITPAPSVTAFSVKVNNISRAISSVTISGTKVRLTLTSAISFGDNVTLSYTKPSQNPLGTSDGGQADAITNKNVENNVKAPVPKYSGSIIEEQSPTLLQITYDLTLANIIPDKSAFVVRVNSTERIVNSISINDNKVILTLNDPVAFGDVVTVEYIKPATNPLQTSDGGQAESSGVKTVNNQVDPVKPVNIGAVIENNTANILELNYDLPLENIRPATNAFTVMVNSLPRAVNSVTISGSKVLLNLSAPVVYGDNVRISYTKPATNPLQTSQGGQADAINNQTVTNNVLPVVPVFVNASVEDAAPDIIRLNYDIALTNIIPPLSAFNVKVNSTAVAVQSINISGTLVTLRLSSPVVYGDAISISYNKPASQPLQTADGGIAGSFSEQTVKNNVYPPELIYVNSLVENSNPAQIGILYNLELEKQLPAISSFIVKVNSIAVAPVNINIEDSKVILTLADSVNFGDKITLSYTQPTENPIQSTDGEKAESFADNLVENNILPPNPVFVNATVEDANPAVVEMNYDIPLITPAPSVTAFSVRVNNISKAISSVTISDTKVRLTLTDAISFGDSVTLSYSKPSQNPLRTADGGLALDLNDQAVINNVEPRVPVYLGSYVDKSSPAVIEMSYDLPLDDISPSVNSFVVNVNSEKRIITSVKITDNIVRLALALPVEYGDTVTLSYKKPVSNPLQTIEGKEAENLDTHTVTNMLDPHVPVYQSSVVENKDPSILEISYSQPLADIIPSPAAFTVMINSAPVAVNSVVISNNIVMLNLAVPVKFGDIVTVAYNKPPNNPLQTIHGAEAITINARSVINNVSPRDPLYLDASIENTNPSLLVMNYNIELLDNATPASAFSVFVNTVSRKVDSVKISGNKVMLSLESPVVYNDIITLSYNKPKKDHLMTSAGGQADTLNLRPVINNVAPVLPQVEFAVIENATPTLLEINYNIMLAGNAPPVSAFQVKVNKEERSISSLILLGKKIVLSLSAKVIHNDEITLSYSKPESNPLQSNEGVRAESFTDMLVINNCAESPKLSLSNSPPVIEINYEAEAFSGFEYKIDASKSYDPDNDSLSFEWTVPTGLPVSSTTMPELRFLAPMVKSPENYKFQLRVSDGEVTVKKEVTIQVSAYKPNMPVARLTNFQASIYSEPDYPNNISDGDINTKWSAYGANQWIQFKTGSPFTISHIEIAFLPDQDYASYFDIYVSKDNLLWEPVFIDHSSCDFSGEKQIFLFPATNSLTDYSYIKINGKGNEINEWNNISEIKVFGTYPEKLSLNPNLEINIMIYPNPSPGHFNISIEEPSFEPDRVLILDMSGRLVHEDVMTPGINTIQLPDHTRSGMYLVQLMSKNLILYVEKLVVSKWHYK